MIKALLVGADVACTTSAVLHYGPWRVRQLLDGLSLWLDEHEYESVAQPRGSMSAASVADPSAFERAQYQAIITSMHRASSAEPRPRLCRPRGLPAPDESAQTATVIGVKAGERGPFPAPRVGLGVTVTRREGPAR